MGATGTSIPQLARSDDERLAGAFLAPNFAIGAVLMMLFARQAAKYLPDVEIIELHHEKKIDAPSGTALRTIELILEGRGAGLATRPAREEFKVEGARGGDVAGVHVHSVRLPGYVAHQECIFGGLGQALTLRHDSIDRVSFMPGVVLACKRVRGLHGLMVGLEHLLELESRPHGCRGVRSVVKKQSLQSPLPRTRNTFPVSEAAASMSAPPGDQHEETLTWTVHLAREQPGRAIAVVAIAVAAAALCLYLFHSLPFALFSLLVVLGATTEFLFPIRYQLTEEAAEQRNLQNWRRIEWQDVRKAYLLEEGVKLSPLRIRTRLEPFRGVLLRFGAGEGEREKVLAAVRRFRDRAQRDADE